MLKLFYRSILSAAIVLSFASAPAVHAEQMVIQEVIVTAQKREQSIQDVPISISAFDQQFLDDAGIDDVLELQFFVPGLTILNNQTPAQTNINIRGVGTAGNSLSLESSVGLYIDGVYRSRQSSSIGDLVDVERVEVLGEPIDGIAVEVVGGLVEQQQLRLGEQRHRDREFHLPAARELRDAAPLQLLGEAHLPY